MADFNAAPAAYSQDFDPTDHPSAVYDVPTPEHPISGSDIDQLSPRQTIDTRHWHLSVPGDMRDFPDYEEENQ